MSRAPRLTLLLAAMALAACTSPEATRMRAGGPGADPGNRSRVVQMHEGSRPYWNTPRRLDDRVMAPIGTATQADRLSRGVSPADSPR
jgi:hypothetical protein